MTIKALNLREDISKYILTAHDFSGGCAADLDRRWAGVCEREWTLGFGHSNLGETLAMVNLCLNVSPCSRSQYVC